MLVHVFGKLHAVDEHDGDVGQRSCVVDGVPGELRGGDEDTLRGAAPLQRACEGLNLGATDGVITLVALGLDADLAQAQDIFPDLAVDAAIPAELGGAASILELATIAHLLQELDNDPFEAFGGLREDHVDDLFVLGAFVDREEFVDLVFWRLAACVLLADQGGQCLFGLRDVSIALFEQFSFRDPLPDQGLDLVVGRVHQGLAFFGDGVLAAPRPLQQSGHGKIAQRPGHAVDKDGNLSGFVGLGPVFFADVQALGQRKDQGRLFTGCAILHQREEGNKHVVISGNGHLVCSCCGRQAMMDGGARMINIPSVPLITPMLSFVGLRGSDPSPR